MTRVKTFIDLLPEQPIVVEFSQDRPDDCSIEITQTVAKF